MRNIMLAISASALFGTACGGAALTGTPVAYASGLSFDCLQVATPIGMNLTCVNPTPFTMNAHFQGSCGPLPMLNEDTQIGPFKTVSRQVPCLPGVQSPSAVATMELDNADDANGGADTTGGTGTNGGTPTNGGIGGLGGLPGI